MNYDVNKWNRERQWRLKTEDWKKKDGRKWLETKVVLFVRLCLCFSNSDIGIVPCGSFFFFY